MLVEKVEGIKHDQGKVDYSLILWEEIHEEAKVMTHGAVKYTPYNWQKVVAGKNGKERYFAAALRHIVSWKLGKRIDEETKLHPLAHAICCLRMLMWADKNIPIIIEPPKQLVQTANKVQKVKQITAIPVPSGASGKHPTNHTNKKSIMKKKKGR